MSQSIPVRDAIEQCLGKRPHISTIWRWSTKGVLGRDGKKVKLVTEKAGRDLFTTIENVRDWVAKQSKEPEAPLVGSAKELVEKKLEEMKKRSRKKAS